MAVSLSLERKMQKQVLQEANDSNNNAEQHAEVQQVLPIAKDHSVRLLIVVVINLFTNVAERW